MKIGILRTLVVLGVTSLVSSAVSAGECLDYEPAMVTIQGSVSLKPAFGPPGFGEDPKHDAREDYLALILDSSVCVAAGPKPHNDDVAEDNIRTMQLVFSSGEAFQHAKQWSGKQISVTGSLYHEFTGHHHTTVLLKVNEIGPAR